jgi:carbon starvation protein
MITIVIAVGALVGYLIAYHTYGRWVARKIFCLDPNALVPSEQLRDDVDFVPTRKEIIFGHHFTSIAGTGPIVGPAIAIFWGWLPALLWVVFGAIFIGAVHDLGALVVSLRNRGQTIGEVAGRIISPRVKLLFLAVLFLALSIVLAIFGLVIAGIFKMFPESVLSVWIEIPLAVVIGIWVYRGGGRLFWPSILALVLMYGAIYVGAYYFPVVISPEFCAALAQGLHLSPQLLNPVVLWTLILMVYCFIASVLPVWTLLQPRDYINSHQLLVALSLLLLGLFVAGFSGEACLTESTPAIADLEAVRMTGAPPIWPFLFITIACGAVSGFHCLVASGTSSKQLANESDAQYVGYGAMLVEGMLAVLVILACSAGLGMGKFERIERPDGGHEYRPVTADDGKALVGNAAWTARYDTTKKWADFGLAAKVGAFVEGGANFLSALGLSLKLGVGIMAVLVASFAATTLDTATRLQRYVVQEIAGTLHIRWLTNKYCATALALVLAFAIAMLPGNGGVYGTGGMLLWPLFGAVNQLLAGLAFMVIVFYLWRRNKPIGFVVVPLVLMVVMPAWAILWQMFNTSAGWIYPLWEMLTGELPWQWHNFHLLLAFGAGIILLQVWMVIEALLLWPRAHGVIEEALPPLKNHRQTVASKPCL